MRAVDPVGRFPFGQPVLPRPPSATSKRGLFVLGAYPSALHVAWTPPAPFRRVAAVAIDNEPTPFWTGEKAQQLVDAWRQAVAWRPAWGRVTIPPGLNGPSGVSVEADVLGALGFARADTCISDCLDTYYASTGLMTRITDTYAPFAVQHGVPPALLARHPSETEIVRAARERHLARLLRELESTQPDTLVTLGNAALRVARELLAVAADRDPGPRLSPDPDRYGRAVEARLSGRIVRWFPLAHPAAPEAYQDAHARWRDACGMSP
jgi:hypothetical protein